MREPLQWGQFSYLKKRRYAFLSSSSASSSPFSAMERSSLRTRPSKLRWYETASLAPFIWKGSAYRRRSSSSSAIVLYLLVGVYDFELDQLVPQEAAGFVMDMPYAAVADGFFPVQEQLKVDPCLLAQAVAVLAHALGVVEGKQERGSQIWRAEAREQEPQVGVHFGGGSYGAAEVGAHLLLVYHHGRGEVEDVVHIGAGELGQPLAGKGGEGLDKLPLRLGIDGIEEQGRLARAGDPGKGYNLVLGYFQAYVLEVVGVGILDDDVGESMISTFLKPADWAYLTAAASVFSRQ
jgi:hypothetical protein